MADMMDSGPKPCLSKKRQRKHRASTQQLRVTNLTLRRARRRGEPARTAINIMRILKWYKVYGIQCLWYMVNGIVHEHKDPTPGRVFGIPSYDNVMGLEDFK